MTVKLTGQRTRDITEGATDYRKADAVFLSVFGEGPCGEHVAIKDGTASLAALQTHTTPDEFNAVLDKVIARIDAKAATLVYASDLKALDWYDALEMLARKRKKRLAEGVP